MRTIFAVSVLAVLVAREGARGCGAAPVLDIESAEQAPGPRRTLEALGVRIDVQPPSDARIYPVCLDDADAGSFRPPSVGFGFEPGARLGLSAPCTLYVFRRDGALLRRSAPTEISPDVDRVVVALPPEPVAGIGISFDPRTDGVHVLAVTPLGPSDGLLRVGDVIAAIDGHPTAGMAMWDFIDVGTGAAGTRAVLQVEAAGIRRTVEVVRDTIGVDDDEQDRRAEIEAKMNAEGLRTCYSPVLSQEPTLAVDVDLSFEIDSLGHVLGDPVVSARGPSSQALEDCIVGRVRGWRFTHRSGTMLVHRAVKFRPR